MAAAADYFFDRRWKADAWSFLLAAIPIERNKVNRRSADQAAELLADGWNLVIFPEGGRSPDGWAQTFRGGDAYLAKRTGRPVVPVHLDGTRHLLPKGGTGIRRSRTTVTFGTPLWPEEGESARRFGARVEAAVATMANEAATDWWTARKQAAQGTDAPAAGTRRVGVAPIVGSSPSRAGPPRHPRGRRLAPEATADRRARGATGGPSGRPVSSDAVPPADRGAGDRTVRQQRAARRRRASSSASSSGSSGSPAPDGDTAHPSSRSANAVFRASRGPWR